MNINEEAEKLLTTLEDSAAKLLSGVKEDKEVVISNRRKLISSLYGTPLASVIHEGESKYSVTLEGNIELVKIEGTLTYE